MEQVKRLGNFVGAHMPVFMPICIALGILLSDQVTPYKGIVPYLFTIITFQGSLNTTLRQVAHTFRHPAKLLAILVTTTVVMPILARVCGGLVFSDPEIVTGIVIEYTIPVAVVSFMWIDMYRGNASLGLAAILVSTVLAPFSIPLVLHLLMGASVHVDSASMMQDLVFMIAIPAIIGVALNEFSHGWGHEKLSPNLGPVCRLLTLIIVTCNATGLAEYVLNFDIVVLQVALFILVFALAGFLLGIGVARLMGASTPEMLSITFCVGLRNISSGAVIAAQFFPGAAIIPVMMGTLFQQIIAAFCGSAIERLTADDRAAHEKRLAGAKKALEEKRR